VIKDEFPRDIMIH